MLMSIKIPQREKAIATGGEEVDCYRRTVQESVRGVDPEPTGGEQSLTQEHGLGQVCREVGSQSVH